jgi:hypothetical protein
MPAFFARCAISSTLPGVEMDKRTPIPFLRSRPFFQSSWFKPIWVLPARSITPSSVPFSSHRSSIAKPSASCLLLFRRVHPQASGMNIDVGATG